jgi:hypothetical protein
VSAERSGRQQLRHPTGSNKSPFRSDDSDRPNGWYTSMSARLVHGALRRRNILFRMFRLNSGASATCLHPWRPWDGFRILNHAPIISPHGRTCRAVWRQILGRNNMVSWNSTSAYQWTKRLQRAWPWTLSCRSQVHRHYDTFNP